MSNALLSSKVTTSETQQSAIAFQALATEDVGVVGVTERGPFFADVQSEPEYNKVFGGFTTASDVAKFVRQFYANVENGGRRLRIARVVHWTDPLTFASKTSAKAYRALPTAALAAAAGAQLGSVAAPFDFRGAVSPYTVLVDLDQANSPTTVTFAALAGARETTGGSGAWHIDEGFLLNVKIDGQAAAQVITFSAAGFVDHTNATAAEVCAQINAQILGARATVTNTTKVTITSDRKGTSSFVEVTGGTANAVLGFSTVKTTATASDMADWGAVTIAELKAKIESVVKTATPGDKIVVTNVGGYAQIATATLGAAHAVQVTAASTLDDVIGWDNAVHSGSDTATLNTLKVWGKTDGTYAHAIRPRIQAASNGQSGYFALVEVVNGVAGKVWDNLCMDPTSADYAETKINDTNTGSDLIAVEDLEAATTWLLARPANVLAAALALGDDGLTDLQDNDYIGSATGGTGIHGLDVVSNLDLLTVPGRATAAVASAMTTYCESDRGGLCLELPDVPANQSDAQVNTYVESTAALLNATQKGAVYWPWLKIANPNPTVFGPLPYIVVPPSGTVAGVYARCGATKKGKFQQPANVDFATLRGVIGFENDESSPHPVTLESVRDLVYPKRINPIRKDEDSPYYLDGTKTLKADGNWPTVGECRGMIMLEKSCKAGAQRFRHSDNTDTDRENLRKAVDALLRTQMKLGCFASDVPAEAYYVDVGPGQNTAVTKKARTMRCKVGVATNTPNDYVEFEFTAFTPAGQ